MIQILFAFIAGLLTVAAPCILPVLPILLGSSVGQQHKSRPVFIVLGFITSFALVSALLSVLVHYIPWLSQDHVRNIAIVLIGLFGVFLIWPLPFEKFMSWFAPAINKTAGVGAGQSNTSGFLLGLTLGIVWAPCAGPILAAILALIAIQGNSAKSIGLLIAYGLGAGIPMLLIAYGSQYATTKVQSIAKYSGRLQQIFGLLILILAFVMYRQLDVAFENKLAGYFPQSTIEQQLTHSDAPTTISELQNYGPAPDFTGISHWINSPPLTLSQLKGKVVLVDFWTYSCINCIRTLPFVTSWYDKYKDNGLVVVGVHTPEFAFEKVTSNVETATKQFNIHYPVAQDNDYGTWQAYHNIYWPAEYLINQQGEIVYKDTGEGNYDRTENTIRQLLGLQADPNAKTSTLGNIQSPEMYFEASRLEYLMSNQLPSTSPQTFTFSQELPLNTFTMSGTWQFINDHAELTQAQGALRLHFFAGKVFMVAAADHPLTLKITVDGQPQPDVTVQASKLYPLFDSSDYSEHTMDIEIPDPGLEAYTFTFG